jgi:hypothetical protein
MFPLQSAPARREVLTGAALLLVPGIGWVLNMGHRIQMVHNMLHGHEAWPAWKDYPSLFKHGMVTLGGMIYYYLPGIGTVALGLHYDVLALVIAGALLLVAATIAIPGYMTHYCVSFDPSEIFNPFKALARCLESGGNYWHAWGIALGALGLSFLGLLALGVGFLVTSVWFWQVAGFSFASSFSQRYRLQGASHVARRT